METLVQKFFENRDGMRRLKFLRNEFLAEAKCNHVGEYNEDCISDNSLSYEDYCSVCQFRHRTYLKLKNLRYENIGILRKLRNMVGVQYMQPPTTPLYELREDML